MRIILSKLYWGYKCVNLADVYERLGVIDVVDFEEKYGVKMVWVVVPRDFEFAKELDIETFLYSPASETGFEHLGSSYRYKVGDRVRLTENLHTDDVGYWRKARWDEPKTIEKGSIGEIVAIGVDKKGLAEWEIQILQYLPRFFNKWDFFERTGDDRFFELVPPIQQETGFEHLGSSLYTAPLIDNNSMTDRQVGAVIALGVGGALAASLLYLLYRQGGIAKPTAPFGNLPDSSGGFVVPGVAPTSVNYEFELLDIDANLPVGAGVPVQVGSNTFYTNSSGVAFANLPFGTYNLTVLGGKYLTQEQLQGGKLVIESSSADAQRLKNLGASSLRQQIFVARNTPMFDSAYMLSTTGQGTIKEIPGCGGCDPATAAWIQARVTDRLGKPVSGVKVRVTRASGALNHRIRTSGRWGTETSREYTTDASGLTSKVSIAPPYYGKCGYGIGPDAAKCASGTAQWIWTISGVPDPSESNGTKAMSASIIIKAGMSAGGGIPNPFSGIKLPW